MKFKVLSVLLLLGGLWPSGASADNRFIRSLDTRSPDTSNGVQPSPIAPHLHCGAGAWRSPGATFPDHQSA